MAVALCTPRSRGAVTITSPDTSVHPDINPNWLTDPADMAVMVAGVKRSREFWATDVMQEFATGGEAYPGSNVTTDAQIEDSIRNSFNTVYHGSCTCAMGKPNDTMAVLDSKARVYGVQGLRVVDASSFPLLPPGHPMATVCKLTNFYSIWISVTTQTIYSSSDTVIDAFAEKVACEISGNCEY